METPSTFYSWLCEQADRDDEIGALAAHVAADESWPKSATEKATMRAHLRGQKLPQHVPSLAMALQEFEEEKRDEADYSEFSSGSHDARIAAIAFLAWCDLGRPSRAEIESRADLGEPAALAILGVRCLLGVHAPENGPFGVSLLERAFEAGFRGAALILARYYAARQDVASLHEWLLRGARAGDETSICRLHAFLAKATRLQLESLLAENDSSEVARLREKFVGDTGQAEWALAAAFDDLEMPAEALAHFEVAARKGWKAAYEDAASLLEFTGCMSEARAWRVRGAVAGDCYCAAMLAEEALREDLQGGAKCPPEERTPHIAAVLTAAEQGIVPALIPSAILYARGDGVPQDCAKAMVLLGVTNLAAGSDEVRDGTALLMADLFPKRRNDIPLEPTIEWLFSTAARSRREVITEVATESWLALGTEMPRSGQISAARRQLRRGQ